MGINSGTIKLKQDMAELINNSKLPPVNILLVLDSMTMQVNQYLQTSIQNESEAESKVKEDGDQHD